MKNTCILIPTRNRPTFLRETLQRLCNIGLGGLPLWVYDDASDDPAALEEIVAEEWENGRVMRGDEKRGQCHGRNALLRECGHTFAILLDDDQYFLELGNLETFTDEIRRDPRMAAVAFQSRDKSDGRLDFPANMGPCRSSFFMGGSVMFHVPTILSFGGYRDFWRYGNEEPELTCRLYREGYYVWYNPRILIEHNHIILPEARRDHREYDFLFARNDVLLSGLNMPLWMGLPIGIVRATRRAVLTHRNWTCKAKGIAYGMACIFRYWSQRTPMSTKQAIAWMRFTRAWRHAS